MKKTSKSATRQIDEAVGSETVPRKTIVCSSGGLTTDMVCGWCAALQVVGSKTQGPSLSGRDRHASHISVSIASTTYVCPNENLKRWWLEQSEQMLDCVGRYGEESVETMLVFVKHDKIGHEM